VFFHFLCINKHTSSTIVVQEGKREEEEEVRSERKGLAHK